MQWYSLIGGVLRRSIDLATKLRARSGTLFVFQQSSRDGVRESSKFVSRIDIEISKKDPSMFEQLRLNKFQLTLRPLGEV
jgi:hypothetical protein